MSGVTNQENLASIPCWKRIANVEWPHGDFIGLSNLAVND